MINEGANDLYKAAECDTNESCVRLTQKRDLGKKDLLYKSYETQYEYIRATPKIEGICLFCLLHFKQHLEEKNRRQPSQN